MAATDAVRFSLGVETGGYGVVAPAMQILRITGESLKTTPTNQVSDEIENTGQPLDAVRTGITAGGDLNGLLSITNWDRLYEALLYSDNNGGTFPAGTLPLSTVTAVYDNVQGKAGNVFSRVALWPGVAVGTWIKMSGWTGLSAVNNKVWKVTNIAGADITVSGGTVFILGAAAAHVAELGQIAIPGTTLRSNSIERWHSDVSGGGSKPYIRYLGAVPNSFDLSMRDKGPITGRFGHITKTEAGNTAEIAVPTAAPTGQIMGGLQVQAILEGDGTLYNTPLPCIKTFNLRVQNGARLQECSNAIDPTGVARGSFNIEGTFSFTYDNTATTEAAIQRWLDGTASGIAFIVNDSAGNGYAFECPEVRPGEISRAAGAKAQDVDITMGFTAFKEAGATGTIMKIVRFDGVA